MELPVLWGDQDLFGHVNNTIHLKWFESARVRYWDDSGMRQIMAPRNWGPILASLSCSYKKQIRYPDQIQTAVRIAELRGTSMVLKHAIYSAEHDAIAAEGESVIVLFDYASQRPQRIGDDLRNLISNFEKLPLS